MLKVTAPRARLSLFAILAVGSLYVEDLLARHNVQSFFTVAIVALGLVLLPDHLVRTRREPQKFEPTNPDRARLPLPMLLFVGWSGVLLAAIPSVQGLQNWLVWLLFPLTATLVAARTTHGTAARLHRLWRIAAVFTALAYLAICAAYGLGSDQSVLYAARPAGWTAVTAMAFLVPWAAIVGAPRWPSFLQFLASGASLTRGSTGVAAVLLLGLAASGKRRGTKIRIFAVAVVIGVAAYTGLKTVPAFRDRFVNGDQALSFHGVSLNTSGRSNLWKATYDAAQDHIWIGHGPGQSQYLIERIFITISHPHNEYLRFLYDTGLIGLTLWVVGMALIGRSAWQRYKTAQRPEDRAVHLAAVLGVTTFMLGSFTDNLSVSIGFALSIGTLIGLSLGRANAGDQSGWPASESSGSSQPLRRDRSYSS